MNCEWGAGFESRSAWREAARVDDGGGFKNDFKKGLADGEIVEEREKAMGGSIAA